MLAFGFVAGQPAGRQEPARAQAVQTASSDTQRSTAARSRRSSATICSTNPELLLEMQDALEAKQKEEQRVANLDVIKNAKDEIFNAAYDGVVGNPNGKVTIVEFYDYNCGYCKRAQRGHAGADGSRSRTCASCSRNSRSSDPIRRRRTSSRWHSAR